MVNLIIDSGNTRVKLFVYEGDKVLESACVEEQLLQKKILDFFLKYSIARAILSQVGAFPEETKEYIQSKSELLVLTNNTRVPFENLYKTPKTLGVDRIALMSAAAIQYASQNVLVIDAGTCVTYDFKNAKNQYLGGAIAPGLQMRYNALHTYTEKLPLLKTTESSFFLGENTETSIHSGVVNGLLGEIEHFIEQTKNRYSNLTIVLTGGDANYLSKRLKNGIFAHSNFLVEGLNQILIYNS